MDRCEVTIPNVQLLISINDDELNIDWDTVRAASAAYDAGNESDGALWAKILTLSYDQGFEEGQADMLNSQMLVFAPPAGHA